MNLKQEFPCGTLKLVSAIFCEVQIRCDHLESQSSRINVKRYNYKKKANYTDDFQGLQTQCKRSLSLL